MRRRRAIAVAAFAAVAALATVPLGLYAHYRLTGLTAHRYLGLLIEEIRRRDPPGAELAVTLLHATLLDPGRVQDPVDRYPPDLEAPLPIWRGSGASALQRDIAPRYGGDGAPIALADVNRWLLAAPPQPRARLRVTSAAALLRAAGNARAGTVISLAPGRYRIDTPIALRGDGRADAPIVLRAPRLGRAILEFGTAGALRVEGDYWFLGNLVLRGACAGACAPPLRVAAGARAVTLRNLFASGVRAVATGSTVDRGLAEGITVLDGAALDRAGGWRQVSLRRVRSRRVETGALVACATPGAAHDCDGTDLQRLLERAGDNALLLLRAGVYRQGARIRRPLRLLAEPGAVLAGGAIAGKGALLVDADLTVEGLECRGVRVSDGNGACLRQQRGDVTLRNVFFHDAQMGVLTGHRGGALRIVDSLVRDSGSGGDGQLGHNVYVNSGTLAFIRSWSLAARNGGHGIKSRAARTLIRDSLVASLNARDSRLVDLPEAGLLHIAGTVLGEGPRSENQDVIGYGLELGEDGPAHPDNRIIIEGNTIYLDRPQGARLLHQRHAGRVTLGGNVVVGRWRRVDGNAAFADRRAAGVAPYPALTRLAH